MKIQLITDSTCDLSPEVLSSIGVEFAPLKVLFGDTEYIDKTGITNNEFYEKMRTSPALPTTSQVNPGEFHELFEKALIQHEYVVCMVVSSKLSGTYNSAVIAKEMLEEPERVFLIDTATTSYALGLMIQLVQEKIKSGADIVEVVKYANKLSEKSQIYCMLDTLENLKRGGRLSTGSALIGKMLNLKVIIEAKDGLVKVCEKARGDKKGYEWMIQQLSESFPDGHVDFLAIGHSHSQKKLEEIQSILKSRFVIDQITVIEIGSVVGVHAGEGAVGFAYFKN